MSAASSPAAPARSRRPTSANSAFKPTPWPSDPTRSHPHVGDPDPPDDVIEALRAGYAAVLLAIADADGHLDPTERRAFTTWLTGATRGEGPAAALLPDGPGPVIASLDAFLSERATANSAIFRTLAALNGHCDPGTRRAYAHELRSLGKEIAEASHGGLRTWWRKISPAEQRALDVLDALLATLEV